MADSKISGLTALTGANLASTDLIAAVDVSDTTMDASGTNKKMTVAELAIGIATVKPPSRAISETHADQSAVNTTTETVVASHAVPTTVAAGDIVRLTAYGDLLNNSGSTVNYVVKTILGATTMQTSGNGATSSNANRRGWRVTVDLLVVATNDQRSSVWIFLGGASSTNPSLATTGWGGFGAGRGTATEDLTVGKTLQVSVTMGTASANADFVCHESFLEVVKK